MVSTGLGAGGGGPAKGVAGSDGHLGTPSEGGSVLLVEAGFLTLGCLSNLLQVVV